MKIFNKKISRYAILVLLVLIGLFLYSANYTPQQTPTGEPAEYLLTGVQSLLEPYFLDEALGKPVTEVERENTQLTEQLTEVKREANAFGYVNIHYRDSRGAPTEIISDRQENIAAIIRVPLSASEESASSLKNKLGLGEPEAVMYPSGASIEIIHVYPKEGVAIYFNEEHDRVLNIITFESTDLQTFKSIFEGKYQDTRNTKAY